MSGGHTLRYDAGARAYDRLTGRWSRMYVGAALDAAGVMPGACVLDVACGTGDAAIAAADRVGPRGRVVAIDISAPMLDVAAAKAGCRSIEFAVADAQQLAYADGSFDAIVCLFGLMFIPDRLAALQNFRRVLRPGGRMATASWHRPEKVPFAGLVAEALAEQLPDEAAELLRPFALSDPEVNLALYRSAGFAEVDLQRLTFPSTFASFDGDFWEPVEAGGGRLGQAYLGLSEPLRQAVRQRVLGRLALRSTDEPFTLEHSAWIVRATRP